MTEDDDSKLEIDWLRTVAGALAAVSSAVALSTLGAAGTIIGAALGSVIITVGGALYSHGLNRSRKRLAEAQTLAMRKVGIAQAEMQRASRDPDDAKSTQAHLAHADERLEGAREGLADLVDEAPADGWGERFGALPWKRIALVAAGLFVATVLTITAFELLTGRTVSQMTGGTDGTDGDGGTTISRIGGGADGSEGQEERPAEEDAPDEPTGSSSESPQGDTPAPAPTPSEVESELPAEPSEAPAPE